MTRINLNHTWLICLWLLALLVVLPAWAQVGVINFHITPEKEELLVNFAVEDKEGAFFEALMDALKAGNTLRVDHIVHLDTVGAWSTRVSETVISRYVSYDLLEDTYKFSKTPDHWFTTQDEGVLKSFLLRVENEPLIVEEKLVTGNEYDVTTQTRFEEVRPRATWYDYLPSGLFKPHLTGEVLYIAR